MVDEATLGEIFSDCELGAVPPIGMAYELKTIWDPKSSLGKEDEVFFEAGDHQNLIRVSGVQFHELTSKRRAVSRTDGTRRTRSVQSPHLTGALCVFPVNGH